jgi:hypothetical protein
MGSSVKLIDATYGHVTADADDHERRLIDTWDNGGNGHDLGTAIDEDRRKP